MLSIDKVGFFLNASRLSNGRVRLLLERKKCCVFFFGSFFVTEGRKRSLI